MGTTDDVIPKNVVKHPYTTGGMKWMPGFSFPAPRKLEQVIKYALLERETPARIREIWNSFHDGQLWAVATTWTREEYDTISRMRRRCPRFIYPVLKGDGKFFTIVSEFQDNYCIFTFLDDYKKNPSTAEPYMSVAIYPDFLERKQLVLVRGDFSGHLTKRDAAHILNLMRHFYIHEPKYLETFNRDPGSFDFAAFVRDCPPPPPANSAQAGKVVRDDAAGLAATSGRGLRS
jgi:hypothetical protein